MAELYFSKKYVCATKEYSTFDKHVRAPLFRKEFTLDAAPKNAEIVITGLGFYRLFVNGRDITKGFLAPYISNTDDVIYYDRYDLTALLSDGGNVIGVMLGDGMQNLITNVWDFNDTVFTSSPKLALYFSAETDSGKTEFEADSFKCTEGPILFNNHRCGVHYDARLEIPGWAEPGLDDSDWREPLTADNPRGMRKLCDADPITVRSEFAPVDVRKGEMLPYHERKDVADYIAGMDIPEYDNPCTGGYIYDFGKNSSGVFRLKIKNAKPGQKISFQCAEWMTPGGKLDFTNINFFPNGYCQRDIYICRGGEEEVYVPDFVYHGYRYLYVYGITEEQATKELLTYIEINSDLSERASFGCSDEVANKLYAMTNNSDLSNFHYFPTDCPHREKNGWTGDAAASSEHMVMTLSVERSWREWMQSIRLSQTLDGHIPGIVPTNGWGLAWGNGPAWDRVMFDLPYYTYIYRGETEMITENAHMMLRYLELITRVRDKRGIVRWGLGDWCPATGGSTSNAAPILGYTNGIMIMDMCRKAKVMFDAAGFPLHAEFAERLGREMKEAVRREYLDESTMTILSDSQTGQAMAIYYDLLTPAEKKQAFDVLLGLIERNNGDFSVGYLGARCIFHVLSDYGYTDLAYRMITKDTFPSYGLFVKYGLTTLPEAFRKDEDFLSNDGLDGTGSLNHHFFGDIKQWFLRQVCGINVNPHLDDPNEILVYPHFVEELAFAEGTYDAPQGRVHVKWTRAGNKIILTANAEGSVKISVKLDNGYCFYSNISTKCYIENGGVTGATVIKKDPDSTIGITETSYRTC